MNAITVDFDISDAKCLIKNKEMLSDSALETLLDPCYDMVSGEDSGFERTMVLEYLSKDESRLIQISKQADDWSGVFQAIRTQVASGMEAA